MAAWIELAPWAVDSVAAFSDLTGSTQGGLWRGMSYSGELAPCRVNSREIIARRVVRR